MNTSQVSAMCDANNILACTAQELGIQIHGSYEGAIYLLIIPIVLAGLWWINSRMNS